MSAKEVFKAGKELQPAIENNYLDIDTPKAKLDKVVADFSKQAETVLNGRPSLAKLVWSGLFAFLFLGARGLVGFAALLGFEFLAITGRQKGVVDASERYKSKSRSFAQLSRPVSA